ncbi:TMEM175 family protein [Streptomyces sp. ZAF1911]|uniref:TMEM175 family protein n=1 Tax=unclassified Streptomyces TaxID=2593676 RepID=UPI002030E681|nr:MULTISPECIES: TMEM175 family protein [unclassified Streptomyces]MCM1967726.1 TMEM175 family protein [Streptomyces sp. G1]MCX5129094.1 TMEM175 family protein [Streptomyces sp. NBC_00347]MCX5299634.1 TMEM175 family protein [Streptomyces sp. NBC_00193]MDD9376731.1 TMEM175 family protein [Streptomyces sp. ZAF1911]
METETGRVEAFSDGVFAVIITILVLELKVPEETGSDFWHGVREQWPHYAAYVVSFLIIGVMWVNHHTIFSHIKRVDRPLLFLNLLVLMVVSVVPYTTNVLAEHLMEEGGSANAAAVLYSLLTVAYALAFLAFWWYVTRVGHLFHDQVDKAGARATRVRFGLGAIAYPLTVVLAFVSAPLTLVAHFLIALYYAANQIPIPLVVEEERLETASDLRK